jgi:cell wall-associated NlpC family hydrolase
MAVATKRQQRYLWRRAAQMGLDVSVLRANARYEGLSGGIGDGGHAFGPFQMNDAGGVLTGQLQGMSPQQKNQWAWSKAGIDHALRGIKSVMGNKRGAAAMRALVYEYERPADMDGAYRDRLAAWKAGPKGQPSGLGTAIAGGKKQQTRFDQQTYGMQALAAFTRASEAAAAGDLRPQATLGQELDSIRRANTFKVSVGPQGGPGGPGKGSGAVGNSLAAQALRMAEKQLGQDYVWGGESRAEGGFDCSGLIQWAYGAAGINIPRVVSDQMNAGRKIKWNQLRPGDLIGLKGKHIVMYAGKGRVIAAPRTGEKVQYQPLSYFRQQAGYQPFRIGRG